MTRLRFHTETGSVHVIDISTRTYTRVTAGSGGMRRDGEPIPVMSAVLPQVGDRLVVLLRLREDGAPTVRTTSQVVRIEKEEGPR